MPFSKISPEKVSSSITHQIEQLILRGVLKPGDRLPSERDLATRLDVSRPSLRDALAELESRELIETRPGAGAYVAQVLGSAFAPPLVKLFSTHQEALFDYIAFRRDLEGLAAARAAEHASETDLEIIRSVFSRMEAAHKKRNPEDEAAIDAEFHLAIIEAAHNVVMVHMMRSMYEMLQAGVFYNRETLFSIRTTREDLLSQHRAILEGIESRNPAKARAATEAHLDYIAESLEQHLSIQRNEEIARQRLAQEKGNHK